MPSRALALAGEARLRRRDLGNPATAARYARALALGLAMLSAMVRGPMRLAGSIQLRQHGLFFLGQGPPIKQVWTARQGTPQRFPTTPARHFGVVS